jgi:16S rRNA (uracil1498-N3)-methyltransferase
MNTWSPCFYLPELLNVSGTVLLNSEESHHLAKVIRLSPGEKICLLNGKGSLQEAEVVDAHPKHSEVRCLGAPQTLATPKITVAFGVGKPAAMEFIVKRCTELGVSKFIPLSTRHSQKLDRWNDERWNRIVLEVCKQNQNPHFPSISVPVNLSTFLDQLTGPGVLFSEHARRDKRPSWDTTQETTLFIGPEGGWDVSELALFEAKKIPAWGLGDTRLRMETAALTALVLAKAFVGEISL